VTGLGGDRGQQGTGKVITGAALIVVVVFGGFVPADVVILQSGLALAVLLDATVVRGLLVPATRRRLELVGAARGAGAGRAARAGARRGADGRPGRGG
jgi:putative drug exporter of the RND superfamily